MKKNNAESAGGAKIMARLIVLLGSLAYIMVFAVVNGSLGFISAMGVTLFGAIGIAKALGEQIAMSYGLIIGLTVGCGVLRGLLRYAEQYCNHYIAFRLLAVLRDKIFGALRVLCPAKLESKRKGAIIAMITSDIETLEVFYAHTISPICIAAVVSTAVFLFVVFGAGGACRILRDRSRPSRDIVVAAAFGRRGIQEGVFVVQRLFSRQHKGRERHSPQ